MNVIQMLMKEADALGGEIRAQHEMGHYARVGQHVRARADILIELARIAIENERYFNQYGVPLIPEEKESDD